MIFNETKKITWPVIRCDFLCSCCLFVCPLITCCSVDLVGLVNNLISDCGTPIVWGDVVPSKIFNPSALTLKVGQLAMCYYNITSEGFLFSL